MTGSAAARSSSGTISNPNLLANLTHLTTRKGSSKNVSFGGRGVRIVPLFRSSKPYTLSIADDAPDAKDFAFSVKSSMTRV
jgi:hypothetical protein